MPLIITKTEIDADINVCFDLARDIQFYHKSLKRPTEIPIAGKITGLVEKNDCTTWETNHLIFSQHLTLKVTELEQPHMFTDEMIEGEFKSYKHEHIFETKDQKTIMTDKFYFESPYGLLGKAIDKLLLKGHMKGLIKNRNAQLKKKAESMSKAKSSKQIIDLTLVNSN